MNKPLWLLPYAHVNVGNDVRASTASSSFGPPRDEELFQLLSRDEGEPWTDIVNLARPVGR
jgi:hypothetical protein